MRKLCVFLALAMVLLVAADHTCAVEGKPRFKLVGTWAGTGSIETDSGRVEQIPVTMRIKSQDGGLFEGTIIFAAPYGPGGTGDPVPFAGIIGGNNRSAFGASCPISTLEVVNKSGKRQVRGSWSPGMIKSSGRSGDFVLEKVSNFP